MLNLRRLSHINLTTEFFQNWEHCISLKTWGLFQWTNHFIMLNRTCLIYVCMHLCGSQAGNFTIYVYVISGQAKFRSPLYCTSQHVTSYPQHKALLLCCFVLNSLHMFLFMLALVHFFLSYNSVFTTTLILVEYYALISFCIYTIPCFFVRSCQNLSHICSISPRTAIYI